MTIPPEMNDALRRAVGLVVDDDAPDEPRRGLPGPTKPPDFGPSADMNQRMRDALRNLREYDHSGRTGRSN